MLVDELEMASCEGDKKAKPVDDLRVCVVGQQVGVVGV